MPGLKKIVISSVVFILLFAFSFGFAYADSDKTGTVNVSALNIRESPNTDARVLETLPEGTKLAVVSNSGNWYKVVYNSITGWVYGDYITVSVSSTSQTSTQSTKTGVVNASVLNVRETASTNAALVTQLDEGTQVTILSSSDGWYKISFSSKTGWASAEYITIKETSLGTGVVTGSTVNVRSGPGTDYEVLTTVQESEKITVASRSGEWYKITTSGGITGWMLSEYVTLGGTSTSRGAADATREITPAVKEALDTRTRLVAYAKKYLGTKYVYGGSTPEDGFDCSGFVQYVFKNYGVTLHRVAADQATQGTKISKSELKPGDLMFFDTNGGKNYINHVGIFIGNGKFIHAANKKSDLVITDISNDFYVKSYMTSRRILK
jgi:N-acetylmuramoyl-L-alanine amidase